MTLRAARVNKGYTLKQAAELIGVNPDTIGRWEKGESYPNVPQIKAIEKAYGITYNQINFLCPNITD
ncbi:helix-turn-helix domain-containing protein [Bilifractor sp. LCP19S3_H10]|uniref:helix-turn-helix domain-containing protein n=1 Tax=Bilifractor sp. LCP19S3_H10 TaxID=3438736 RepID=UPI003F93B9D6